MRSTPITSALKRKYSPFKKDESTAQKESKQMLADETGVYVQKKITTPGTEGTAGTKGTPKKSLRQAYDDALALGYRTEDESFEDYAKRAKADPKYGTSGTEGTEGTEGTPEKTKTSEVKLKEKVEGTGKRSWQSREDLRGGTQAASKSKRAATSQARAETKLAKMGYNPDKPLVAGDKGYNKQQRLLAKVKKQKSRVSQADEEALNFQKMSEAGKTRGETYIKGERDKMQSEVDDQSKLEARTSGPGAAKKFFGSFPKDISSDIQMKFSPAKFKSYGKNSPMKKLSDLSGDGKITKKDVLIGRGVIGKDGSPAKYGNKKSPYKMKGFGNKSY